MATPKKLPSGNWRVQVFSHMDGDKKRYKSFTASTKAEAARMAAEYQAGERDRAGGRLTVKECVDQYIDSRRAVLSPSSLRGYNQSRKYYRDIENIYVHDLTSADVQYLVSRLSETHSPKTVRNIYSLLMSSIKQVNDRRFHVTLPAARPVEYHTPTDRDVELLLANASRTMTIAILLASVGTMRRGEICALDYEDVLYDFNAVYVHRSMVLTEGNEWIIKDMPKTSGSVRRVLLPKEVIKVIGHGKGLVYPCTPGTLTSRFIELRNKCGLQCRFHDLRHYAASIMHAIGVPDQYIMERGGWTSDKVLKAVYRNTLSDRTKQFSDLTNDYFSKNITRNITRDKEKYRKVQ